MIPAFLWKEYREQRAIWFTLTCLSFAVLIVVPWMFPPDAPSGISRQFYLDSLALVVLILVWTYGMVCGALLLAGERENGTQGFLDILPAARLSLWLVKTMAGGLFITLQIVLVVIFAQIQPIIEPSRMVLGIFALLYVGLLGMGWGLFFSARADNVLMAVGLAMFAQIALIPVLQLLSTLPFIVLTFVTGNDQVMPLALVVGPLVLLLLPWPLSALKYSQPDRERNSLAVRLSVPVIDPSWRQAWWLTREQSRGFVLGLLLFSFLAGWPVMVFGLLFWPLLSLLTGALCGVTVFLDEQGGAFRFLGEQRIPLTRLWLVKMSVRLLQGLASLAILLLPSLIVLFGSLGQREIDPAAGDRAVGRLIGSPLVGQTIPLGLFLLAPVLYGFSMGHLCGILFRKPIVALVAAFGLSLLLLSLWVPSFLCGGLHLWQVLLVPIALILCTRWMLRSWTTDRIASWTVVKQLGVTAGLCSGLLVLGLGYRVLEVPNVCEPDDLSPFLAALPDPEDNLAGLAIRGGLARIEVLSRTWDTEKTSQPLFPLEKNASNQDRFVFQLFRVSEQGWPAGAATDGDVARWLDAVFKEECWHRMAQARGKPPGILDDPRRETGTNLVRRYEPARLAGIMLASRGLLMQQRGKPEDFVDQLDLALTIVRTLQNAGSSLTVLQAINSERTHLIALDRWLENLPHRVELLHLVGEVLDRHIAWLPDNYRQADLVEYSISRNRLEASDDWLEQSLPLSGKSTTRESQIELVKGALKIPWEAERQARLFRACFWERSRLSPTLQQKAGPFLPATASFTSIIQERHRRRLVRLQIARLKVALRHYQADKGQPAQNLDALVPGSIAAIPRDPFDSQPLRYRLSKGEEILWSEDRLGRDWPEEMLAKFRRSIPRGQGILWSIGEDLVDDDARRQGLFPNRPDQTEKGEDLIYLVPMVK
jgi:hypothetical protein